MSFRKNAAVALMSAAALSLSIMSLMGLSPAIAAEERLSNSGFENGLEDWQVSGETTGCTPRSGSGVLALNADSSGGLTAQNIENLPAGTYTFTGHLRLASSDGVEGLAAYASIKPLNETTATMVELLPDTAYSSWSLQVPVDGTTGVRVSVVASSDGEAVICLDDLSVQGPLVALPSPTAYEAW